MSESTGSAAIRILGVDDNHDIGRALGRWLQREPGFRWVGIAPNADALLDVVDDLRPDIVLLDIDMPGRDPLDALKELSAARPSVRVIILSGHVRRELIDRAFGAGAWGYLSKNDDLAEIAASLRRVINGHLAMSPDVLSAIST